MQKLSNAYEILKQVLVLLWDEQRDVVLIWGLFCFLAMLVGAIELSLAIFCGGIAGVLILIAFGYLLFLSLDGE